MRALLEGCHACILFFNILQHFFVAAKGQDEELLDGRQDAGCLWSQVRWAPGASTFLAHDEQIAFQQAFTH